MPPLITILIPVLDRPQRVQPTLDSITASTRPGQADILFLASLNDDDEIAELERLDAPHMVMDWPAGPGDYARKCNLAATLVTTPWVFTAADDLHYHPGWLDEAMRVYRQTHALVIGTNDLSNPVVKKGLSATHLLVHRSYLDRACIDEPGHLFCEKYHHNCVDSECVETAKYQHAWAFAADSHVEHLHHVWRKAPDDATYQKGRRDHPADRRLFQSRRHLWTRRVVRAYPVRVSGRQRR